MRSIAAFLIVNYLILVTFVPDKHATIFAVTGAGIDVEALVDSLTLPQRIGQLALV